LLGLPTPPGPFCAKMNGDTKINGSMKITKVNFFIRIDFKQKYIAYSQFLVELVRNLLLKGSIKAT
jgi:hypothetical protein